MKHSQPSYRRIRAFDSARFSRFRVAGSACNRELNRQDAEDAKNGERGFRILNHEGTKNGGDSLDRIYIRDRITGLNLPVFDVAFDVILAESGASPQIPVSESANAAPFSHGESAVKRMADSAWCGSKREGRRRMLAGLGLVAGWGLVGGDEEGAFGGWVEVVGPAGVGGVLAAG